MICFSEWWQSMLSTNSLGVCFAPSTTQPTSLDACVASQTYTCPLSTICCVTRWTTPSTLAGEHYHMKSSIHLSMWLLTMVNRPDLKRSPKLTETSHLYPGPTNFMDISKILLHIIQFVELFWWIHEWLKGFQQLGYISVVLVLWLVDYLLLKRRAYIYTNTG